MRFELQQSSSLRFALNSLIAMVIVAGVIMLSPVPTAIKAMRAESSFEIARNTQFADAARCREASRAAELWLEAGFQSKFKEWNRRAVVNCALAR